MEAEARAGARWRALIEDYEAPPLDDAIREELAEYVERRRPVLIANA
jgi:trimethylamine--corrinoid protein Co-methyltransferase